MDRVILCEYQTSGGGDYSNKSLDVIYKGLLLTMPLFNTNKSMSYPWGNLLFPTFIQPTY